MQLGRNPTPANGNSSVVSLLSMGQRREWLPGFAGLGRGFGEIGK